MPHILKQQANQQKGQMARLSSFVGAIAVAELVKTTLGPKGMDKILQPIGPGPKMNNINVTNDGATILRSMHVDNPAAKILIDISKTQDQQIGDGTTTVAVLAGQFLREGQKLINQKIHPQIIISGWRKARDVSSLILLAMDHSHDQIKFKQSLLNIARSTLSSKLLTNDKEHFAKLAVEAVLRIKGSHNLEYIQVIKKLGGIMKDSFLCDGLILEKTISIGCPKILKNCRVLVANTPLDYDKIKIYGTRVRSQSMDKIQEIQQAQKQKLKNKCQKIAAYKSNVFINRQLIYDYPEQVLVQKGLLVIQHADFEGIQRIAVALGAQILSTFDNPQRSEQILGYCDTIEQILIGQDKVIKFSGCKRNQACTIVLRGASQHILDEAQRSLHDALCVLIQTVRNKRIVYGGGNTQMKMSLACLDLAKKIKGKQVKKVYKAIAIQAYGRALQQIPTIIANNGGYDSAELIQNFKVQLQNGNNSVGINMTEGKLDCMEKLGVMECFRSKQQALLSASQAAQLIMRVDDIVTCAPRPRRQPKLH